MLVCGTASRDKIIVCVAALGRKILSDNLSILFCRPQNLTIFKKSSSLHVNPVLEMGLTSGLACMQFRYFRTVCGAHIRGQY